MNTKGDTFVTVVKFYDTVADDLLKFAVILAKSGEEYVFCKHRQRDTWESPGGHREPGETIEQTARRELYEETGALSFDLQPVCAYSVTVPNRSDDQEIFGMLYFAQIHSFEPQLHSEIEKIRKTSALPDRWTYPDTQLALLRQAQRRGFC